MGVEGLSGMLTHMHVHGCEQAQPAVHPRVLLCRMALLSSALQVEEIEPLVRGKEQRREGEKRSAAVLPTVVMAGTGCVLDASRRVGKGAAVVVVVSSGSAQQLQRRVLTDMRKGGGVGGGGDLLLCDKVLFRCCCQHPCYPCG